MAKHPNFNLPIKLENRKICCFSKLQFFRLFFSFEKLEIIKLENLVVWSFENKTT
jgi:uncharacterized membrane protein YqjE